ncbi:MAG: ammonia-forming cytochrome c nitrite reductase subunit c552 [Kofleriaceae bacterium]
MKALLVVLVACGGSQPSPPAARSAPSTIVASNVLRGDYAGSEACADCHAEIYKKWAASPMRNMTRDAKAAAIRAPFAGASLTVGTDTVAMTTIDGARVMTLTAPAGTQRFRITKVVGGRYREDFVGIAADGIEHVLPATYVFSTQSWRYKGYSVMVKERPAMSAKGVWSQECIACHNTLPLATYLYDELYGPGLPGYQGKLSDRLLPKRLAWPARARDEAGLARALAAEITFLGGEPPGGGVRALLAASATTSQRRLDGTKLVELGVGCEACHNGSRAHAAKPELRPAYAIQSSVIGMAPPPGQAGTRAQWINHTCSKCHTVLFSRYPWTWEGGMRNKDPGGSTTNSGEGRDFALGGCATQMSCTTCHDPHAEDAPDKLAQLATMAGNATCTGCHAAIAAAGKQHSHHDSVSCIDCHMPKKNMGLDYALVRYHRIGSPTDPARVTRDRPLECALCHADKSVEALVAQMESWWGKRYDRAPLRALYGDNLDVNAIRTTLVRGKPHEQAAAIVTLGATRDRTVLPHLAPHLAHDYPLVRYYAQRALQTITGAAVAVDVNGAAADVRRAADSWLRAQQP